MMEQILKMTPNMAKPNARPSGMAMVSRPERAWQPHRYGLFYMAYKGIYSNTETGYENSSFNVGINSILFSPPSKLNLPRTIKY